MYEGKKILGIIPARGESKGLPRKNVQFLCGKPVIVHTIEHARASRLIDRVIVSTDDHEIAEISRHNYAEVVWRPAEISGDRASSESALLHVVGHLEQTEGFKPDMIVFLQCTAPLTTPEDIDGTIQAFLDNDADCALAVTPFYGFLWRQDPQAGAIGINHDSSVRFLRQEREPQLLETGAVYVMRTTGFLQARHRFFGKIAVYVIPQERSLDIDEAVDLRFADVLLRERNQRTRLEALPDSIAAIVLDFDGVFTDNSVIVFQDGREAVVCDRGDGWGISILKELGLHILVVSTEENPVVQARCKKLDITCVHGVQNKLASLRAWLEKHALDLSQTIYVGNDLNDLSCLRAVACGVAPSDAHPQAKAAAQLILCAPGGRGAVRELIDLIAQKKEAIQCKGS